MIEPPCCPDGTKTCPAWLRGRWPEECGCYQRSEARYRQFVRDVWAGVILILLAVALFFLALAW